MLPQISRTWQVAALRRIPTTAQRRYASSSPNKGNQVKFWPFFAVIGMGTAAYIALAKRRLKSKSAPSKDSIGFR